MEDEANQITTRNNRLEPNIAGNRRLGRTAWRQAQRIEHNTHLKSGKLETVTNSDNFQKFRPCYPFTPVLQAKYWGRREN
jgi:hypothetical protein